MKKWAMLLCLLPLLLGGCGSRQLEEEMLVIVLGLDQLEGGDIRLSVKAPSTAEGSSSGDEQKGYLVLEATGHGFSQAAALLDASTPRRLNFSQVREVVLGETAAKSGDLSQYLRRLEGLPRMRGAAAVIVCQGEAAAFVQAQKPHMGLRLSRYAEATLAHYADKGFTPATTLEEGVRDLGFGFRDPLFVAGAVNDFSHRQPEAGESALRSAAGEMSRKSVDAIDLFGAAATDGVSVSGRISGQEMALLYLLQGGAHSLDLSGDHDAPLTVYARTPARLWVDLSASPAVLGVQVLCEVHFPPGEMPDGDQLRLRLREDLESAIRHLQALRCDGVGFGQAAVQKCRTVSDWEKMDWRNIYTGADIRIDLALQFRAY